jgi:small subunit ribosomal protein S4
MGDPGRQRKKYQVPSHPWRGERIAEENILEKEYGTKNKTEIYRLQSLLSKFKREAKRLIAIHTEQAELEKKRLLSKLESLKLLSPGAKLDNVLAMSIKDLMERRIQTLLLRKGMARSVKQARQFITHKHVMVKGKLITSPSTLLAADEEATLEFVSTSALANPAHPEREIKKKAEEPQKEKKKKEQGRDRQERRPRQKRKPRENVKQ